MQEILSPTAGLPFYERTVLPNGLRILTSSMPHTHSVTVAVYVGAGSRYERDGDAGVSHFLEHMLFKGTEKWHTAREIAEKVDGVGGVMNGATDREYTLYYVKVARPHFDMALDVLFQLVAHPLLEESEMDKERQVVLEELAMVEDSPAQVAEILLDGLIWPDNPLGRDIAGSPESVTGLTRDAMTGYFHDQYVPNNTVISVAGNITHEQIVAAVSADLDGWAAGSPSTWLPAPSLNGTRCAIKFKTTEQAHLSMAMPGIPLNHEDRYALSFLSIILSEGMSSRLFVELREKRGLVYDVSTYTTHLMDTGTFSVYTGVDPKNAAEALTVILAELDRLATDGPHSDELTKARELSKGRLLLRMEDSRAVAGWLGAQELLLGRVRTVDEVVELIDSVSLEDLQRVSREIIDTKRLHLAVVGPYRSEKRFAALLPN
ncbi:MAG TPA: pitrilysin family protein [Dehalococcoidia bacterium]|nr:pitrilysin family protein [Dehalococcoidia bacterium]